MLIIRYQFHDPNPALSGDMLELLKLRFGAAVNFIAGGTILIDSDVSADTVYELLVPLFTFDDKLFVGQVDDFRSLHNISNGPRKLSRAV